MRRAPAPLVALLAIVAAAFLVAGCGGSTKTSAAGGAPAGAAFVPATAPVYVSVNTDLSGDQFKQADELLQKFPGRAKLLAELRKSLSQDGVDLEKLKSAVGPEVDFVVLDITKSPTVVALTQPKDEQKFNDVLESGSKPAAHEKVGDWTVFSDEQASIDAFKAAQSGDKLSDSSRFADAMAKLPDDALVKAYVDGTGLNQALREQLQGQVAGAMGGLDNLKWLAASLEAQSDGAAMRFVASGIDQGGSDYTSDLVKKAPQGALVFASFKGTDKTFDQLSQGASGAMVEQFLGLKLADVANLFKGETAVWVSAGTPIPEVTVVLGGDPKQSIATLDKLTAKLSVLAGGATPKQTTLSGVTLTEVPLGPLSIFYGEVDGKVLITDTPNAVRDFQSGSGSSLADDAAFKSAVDASGMPDSYGGFLYVNIPDTIAAFSGLASSAGSGLPPDVDANVRPLRSAVLWSTQDGGNTDVQAFVEIR
jgi:hypothetical protein